jgi:hypothetical protein
MWAVVNTSLDFLMSLHTVIFRSVFQSYGSIVSVMNVGKIKYLSVLQNQNKMYYYDCSYSVNI